MGRGGSLRRRAGSAHDRARLLIEAQIAAMRADDWPSAFALESPDLQAQYGTPAALWYDVTAHYAPFPAIASARFLDIVTFRGLPTYRVTGRGGDDDSVLSRASARRRLVANSGLRAGASAEQLKIKDAARCSDSSASGAPS